MLWIKASLPVDEPGVQNYVAAWTRLLEQTGHATPGEVQKALFDHLYENLNVLDTKTGIVISLNGILIASYVFILAPGTNHISQADAAAFLLAVLYSVVAIMLCLRVIWVHWSSRANLRDPASHMHVLIWLRTRRTIDFRRAWTFTAVSLVALVILVSNQFLLRDSLDLTWPAMTVVVVHLSLIYGYDNLVLFAQRRNVPLRLNRIWRAIRDGRWGMIVRALRSRGAAR
ncbi:MAG TPA: hypothetical protein VIE16_08040 [Phenylobacterium sp.]|jgi:hypothetical protein